MKKQLLGSVLLKKNVFFSKGCGGYTKVTQGFAGSAISTPKRVKQCNQSHCLTPCPQKNEM